MRDIRGSIIFQWFIDDFKRYWSVGDIENAVWILKLDIKGAYEQYGTDGVLALKDAITAIVQTDQQNAPELMRLLP